MSDAIRGQDELLQLLYWLQGERLGEAFAPAELARFLGEGEDAVLATLGQLERRGLVVLDPAGWRTTDAGAHEGGRRFSEELSGRLGRETHLTCSVPDCDCHQLGGAADCHGS